MLFFYKKCIQVTIKIINKLPTYYIVSTIIIRIFKITLKNVKLMVIDLYFFFIKACINEQHHVPVYDMCCIKLC